MKTRPTIDALHRSFSYDPETGIQDKGRKQEEALAQLAPLLAQLAPLMRQAGIAA